MTGDAREEAEALVMGVVECTEVELDAHVDALVAALAAAIKWRDAARRSVAAAEAGAMPAWEKAEKETSDAAWELEDALSALRGTS